MKITKYSETYFFMIAIIFSLLFTMTVIVYNVYQKNKSLEQLEEPEPYFEGITR